MASRCGSGSATELQRRPVGARRLVSAGGKPQQFFDREQMAVLQKHGFISERKATNFDDFDKEVGNIVPKDGPWFEVVPLDQAVPPPAH
jgi:hypothetical protein